MEDDPAKSVRALFYRTSNGNEPVREWLKSLSADDRMVIGIDIKTVEFGWPIGMPTCRSLGGGIWEVRSSLADGRIARVLFALYEGKMYLLNGFIKKTQKTPPQEIELARRRLREVMQ
jgi:phage-related protein